MKYSYKRPPFDFYDTVAMECWLSDMAKKGLVFNGNNLAYFRFLKTMPQNISYRVEPAINDDTVPRAEMLSAHKDAGWEFVAHQGNLFFIWMSDRAEATELHTDPIVQGESYRRLCKKLTHTAVFTGLCVIAIFAMIIGGFVVSDRPVSLFLASPLYILLTMAELLVIVQTAEQARRAIKIRRMLACGFSLDHKKDYKKEYRFYRIINLFSLLFSALILITSVLTLTTDWRKSTEDVNMPLPYLSLDLIEQSEDFAWAEPMHIKNDVNYHNYVDFTWTLLVPEYYRIHQEGAEQPHKWPDGSGYYSPAASTEYYRLTFSVFAPLLFDELMRLNLLKDEAYTITEPNRFDRTVIAQNGFMTHLFVHTGNQVIYIRYHGYADLSQRLDLLADILSSH